MYLRIQSSSIHNFFEPLKITREKLNQFLLEFEAITEIIMLLPWEVLISWKVSRKSQKNPFKKTLEESILSKSDILFWWSRKKGMRLKSKQKTRISLFHLKTFKSQWWLLIFFVTSETKEWRKINCNSQLNHGRMSLKQLYIHNKWEVLNFRILTFSRKLDLIQEELLENPLSLWKLVKENFKIGENSLQSRKLTFDQWFLVWELSINQSIRIYSTKSNLSLMNKEILC